VSGEHRTPSSNLSASLTLTDTEPDTFLQINDQINTVLGRYESFKKGDYVAAANPIPQELASTSARNELSLIDLDDSVQSNATAQPASSGIDDLDALFGPSPAATNSITTTPPNNVSPSMFSNNPSLVPPRTDLDRSHYPRHLPRTNLRPDRPSSRTAPLQLSRRKHRDHRVNPNNPSRHRTRRRCFKSLMGRNHPRVRLPLHSNLKLSSLRKLVLPRVRDRNS
jgi:hypothetical protein